MKVGSLVIMVRMYQSLCKENKMTPGPAEDWKITPEPVQEMVMEIAAKTIRKIG